MFSKYFTTYSDYKMNQESLMKDFIFFSREKKKSIFFKVDTDLTKDYIKGLLLKKHINQLNYDFFFKKIICNTIKVQYILFSKQMPNSLCVRCTL